jgi:SNF2 family DNA or RNA helicase
MKFNPHKYQEEAIDFAFDLKKAMWAIFIGGGKTVCAGTLIKKCLAEDPEIKKVLVVATKRLVQTTWPLEFEKWDHLQGIEYRVLTGDPRRRLSKMRFGDVHFINYEGLKWLFDTGKFDYDMVVFDESSKMKNPRTKRFRAIRVAMASVKRVVCMTGTPVSNGFLDLWSQIFLLDSGQRLGRTFQRYRTQYFDSDYFGFTFVVKPGAETVIEGQVKDICLSLTGDKYMQLPQRNDLIDYVQLPPSKREDYAELKREMVLRLTDAKTVEAVNAAVLTGKCVQFTSGAIYIDDDGTWEQIHTEKLDALEELLDINAGPVICAYQFKHELERLKARFPYGRTLDDDGILVDWNWGKVRLLFLHPASGGHGLNLQEGGNRIVWLSLPWSLELYAQTCGRIHRQGQSQPTFIHHLVAQGTIDETILEALRRKATVQDVLLEQLANERRKTA